MSRRVVRRITLWLTLGLVILGCATPVLVTPPPPVSEPGAAETIIVQTAGAAQTQTVEALPPTSTPTITPLVTRTATVSPTPTATFLFLFPTETSLPEGFFEDDEGTGNGDGDGESDGFQRTPPEWACRVLSKSPTNGAVISGDSFKAIWTVQNTGTQAWPKKSVDIVYASGARLNHGKPYYDIPAAVGPGGTLTISVTMYVPRSKDYNTRWTLKIGKREFCPVRFTFSVQ
jgi:hypothetical protein